MGDFLLHRVTIGEIHEREVMRILDLGIGHTILAMQHTLHLLTILILLLTGEGQKIKGSLTAIIDHFLTI